MKRWVVILVVGLFILFGTGQAQSYVGFGLSYVALTAPPQYGLPILPELQVGGLTAPEFGSVKLRASLGTLLLFSNIGFDALASIPFPNASLRLYLGGGPNVLVLMGGDTLPGQESPFVFFGLHGTVGVEPLMGSFRPFAELQPAAAFRSRELVIGLRARAGLNFYF